MNTTLEETILEKNTILVSETDIQGRIIYADATFVKICEYSLEELIGKPHNIIRHPDMPKAAFKGLWETIQSGKIWQGFVKNRTKNNKFYWVYATVFPNGQGNYISVRKMATREEIEKYEKIYAIMKAQERSL
jgi:PAS domain S-box-containing protein